MKDVSTIEQACNGILLRSDEYSEVMEFTHEGDKRDNENLFRCLGRYLYCLVKGVMDEESTDKVRIEINITKAE